MERSNVRAWDLSLRNTWESSLQWGMESLSTCWCHQTLGSLTEEPSFWWILQRVKWQLLWSHEHLMTLPPLTSLSPVEHIYWQGSAERICTRSNAAFVSKQSWGMITWDLTQLQSVIWTLCERQAKPGRTSKGCAPLSTVSFQHLWWPPVFKLLALPIEMLWFVLFWFHAATPSVKNH